MLDNRKDYMYLRLSKEDGDVEEGSTEISNSILSQRICIKQYIKEKSEFQTEIEEIIDDGYSGTNMYRPGIQHLLDLMKKGRVRTIIVRDLSRFARNYLEAGHYLEFIFPLYDVRFISINDQYDSDDYRETTGGLELAIRNLINQMYSHDISKKIKSAVDLKKYAGEYVYGTAPYGYKKGEKKNTIVIDPEAAAVVKDIFQWAAEGMTITQIAVTLNEKKVTTPSVYLASVRGKYKTTPYWSYSSVQNILKNRIYTGDTVPFKSHVIRVGSDNLKFIPEELQEIVPCTHEAIVSRELYYKALSVIKTNVKSPKTSKKGKKYLFTSYLVCGCCGNRLCKGKPTDKIWVCTTARYNFDLDCNQVKIREEDLYNVVLHALQSLCKLFDANIESGNKQRVMVKSKSDLLCSEIRSLYKKISILQSKKMEFYEKYVSSVISQNEFLHEKELIMKQIADFQSEIEKKEKEYNEIKTDIEIQEEASIQFQKVAQYRDIEKLTPELMRELIQRIIIMPDRRIKIIWNFKDECDMSSEKRTEINMKTAV